MRPKLPNLFFRLISFRATNAPTTPRPNRHIVAGSGSGWAESAMAGITGNTKQTDAPRVVTIRSIIVTCRVFRTFRFEILRRHAKNEPGTSQSEISTSYALHGAPVVKFIDACTCAILCRGGLNPCVPSAQRTNATEIRFAHFIKASSRCVERPHTARYRAPPPISPLHRRSYSRMSPASATTPARSLCGR